MSEKPIIRATDLRVWFSVKRGLFGDLSGKLVQPVRAVDGLSLSVNPGEIVSLVGESGSGKTTTGKALLHLVKRTGGAVEFRGEPIRPDDAAYMKAFRRKAQMIYQDPYQSVNPRSTVLEIVTEPLCIHKMGGRNEQMERAIEALERAGIHPAEDFLPRYPHELSGGQRQRVVIAGSMILRPDFVVADEPVSMLDASIRAGVLKLMLEERERRGVAYLFITHDLSLAWQISDRIAILYLGRIMELGSADILIRRGLHPYTKALTAIMPSPGVRRAGARPVLAGETPDPAAELSGCGFHPRCPLAQAICREVPPAFIEYEQGHFAACHFAGVATSCGTKQNGK